MTIGGTGKDEMMEPQKIRMSDKDREDIRRQFAQERQRLAEAQRRHERETADTPVYTCREYDELAKENLRLRRRIAEPETGRG